MRNSENVAPVCVISEAEICDKLNEKKASRQSLSKINGNQVFLFLISIDNNDFLNYNTFDKFFAKSFILFHRPQSFQHNHHLWPAGPRDLANKRKAAEILWDSLSICAAELLYTSHNCCTDTNTGPQTHTNTVSNFPPF